MSFADDFIKKFVEQLVAALTEAIKKIIEEYYPKPSPNPAPGPEPEPQPEPNPQPPHGQTIRNVLAETPFSGKELNKDYWNNLESYCKAGPTELILADMLLIPGKMKEAGFPGRDGALYYALTRTIGGANWGTYEDVDLIALKAIESEIDAWWSKYIQAIVHIMKVAPQTTALIIINDGEETGGGSLGNGTLKYHMQDVADRVKVGEYQNL